MTKGFEVAIAITYMMAMTRVEMLRGSDLDSMTMMQRAICTTVTVPIATAGGG
jgi:hypothetical protein